MHALTYRCRKEETIHEELVSQTIVKTWNKIINLWIKIKIHEILPSKIM